MKEIHKKVLPEYFEAVKEKIKPFEIRKDEDSVNVGDVLVLEEWNQEYTGYAVKRKVSYVLRDVPEFGLMEGYCIIGLEKNDPDEYKNKNEVTVEGLIEVLCRQDKNAIVQNGDGENIRVYPGKENKTGGRNLIMIC